MAWSPATNAKVESPHRNNSGITRAAGSQAHKPPAIDNREYRQPRITQINADQKIIKTMLTKRGAAECVPLFQFVLSPKGGIIEPSTYWGPREPGFGSLGWLSAGIGLDYTSKKKFVYTRQKPTPCHPERTPKDRTRPRRSRRIARMLVVTMLHQGVLLFTACANILRRARRVRLQILGLHSGKPQRYALCWRYGVY